MQNIITESQAKQLIANTAGAIFITQFVKKDKSVRDMLCRLNVKKYLKTNKASTTAHLPQYITVFEMGVAAGANYRNINITTMLTLTINKVVHVIVH